MTKPSVVVAGAGIGGLAAAIGLRQAGCDVRVIDRAASLGVTGAGISLWPNGLRALDALGLREEIEAAGAPARGTAMHRADGHRLGGSVADRVAERTGRPLLVVHRADLQRILVDALAPVVVTTNRACMDIEVEDDEVVVHCSDATTLRADLLVGADGIHSFVATHRFGAAAPAYAGYTAWRGVAPLDPATSAALRPGEYLGRGCLFGLARLPRDYAYWWASVRGPRAEPVGREALLERFGGWADPIPAVLAATPPEAIIQTPLETREPVTHMADGRIALVGDAAHPMLPNLGQGGCQAAEDAAALASAVRSGDGDLAAGLERYGTERAEHTREVVRASRQMARVVHVANPAGVALRNLAMRATPASASARRLAPIVGR